MKKITSVASFARLDTNTVAPARELYSNIDFKGMDTKKKDFLEKIVLELEQAQIFDFSSKYRYIKVGIILREAKKELNIKGDDWKSFYELLGLKERVELRCRQIAGNKWFTELTEEDAPKLHHLTQADMITMSKEKDEEKFNKMLNDGICKISKSKPTNAEIAEAFQTAYDKAGFSKITLESYKTYSENSVTELIEVIDELLIGFEEEPTKFYQPTSDSADVTKENDESVEA